MVPGMVIVINTAKDETTLRREEASSFAKATTDETKAKRRRSCFCMGLSAVALRAMADAFLDGTRKKRAILRNEPELYEYIKQQLSSRAAMDYS